MKLICINQGESFLRYPDGSVTVGKTYEIFTDFEVPNTLFFNGDDGIVYKIIPGYFSKPKRKKYEVLSPDGFTIEKDVPTYTSMKKAVEAYTIWKKRFELQGFYSSNNGRIHLEDLDDNCYFNEIS